MKFGTFVDLTEKLRMQKNFWKIPSFYWVATLKNAIVICYASMNMLKFLLQSQFLSLR